VPVQKPGLEFQSEYVVIFLCSVILDEKMLSILLILVELLIITVSIFFP
jgi:hypothetical protein